MSGTGPLIRMIEDEANLNLELCEDVHGETGGNIDDAYQLGIEHGRIEFANELYRYLESLA